MKEKEFIVHLYIKEVQNYIIKNFVGKPDKENKKI